MVQEAVSTKKLRKSVSRSYKKEKKKKKIGKKKRIGINLPSGWSKKPF